MRVKSILSYQRPVLWSVFAAVAVVLVAAICLLTDPLSARLGSIEGQSITTSAASVWTSDGASYQRIGPVSDRWLQELAELRILQSPISQNRSQGRDKSHTLVLQTRQEAEPSAESYVKGLYIHFNSDFTAVWVNDGVKPTLSYAVKAPQKAAALYGELSADSVALPAVGKTDGLINTESAAQLQKKLSQYLGLPADNGLSVYIWQMAEGSYSCVLLPGRTPGYSPKELWAYHRSAVTMEEMRAIVATYMPEISQSDVAIIPTSMPHSSYFYQIDEAYCDRLTSLFWSGFAEEP